MFDSRTVELIILVGNAHPTYYMGLNIRIPQTYQAERRYILSVLLGEFLGIDCNIEVAVRNGTQITADGGCKLVVNDCLFALPESLWLTKQSLPHTPLKQWNIPAVLDAKTVKPAVPVVYGGDPELPGFFTTSDSSIEIGLDIFGTSFYMLTRYEEAVNAERDNHNRFPSKASLAFQERFLDRPIVNEYLEILWACMKLLWPGLKRKEKHFQTYATHDVDEPFRYAFRDWKGLIKIMGSNVYRCHTSLCVLSPLQGWIKVKREGPPADPYNTFDRIMDINESFGLKCAFYFMAGRTHRRFDGVYRMEHPLMRSLLCKIHRRGHEIGLHPSYHTYRNPSQTQKEFNTLKNICAEEGIKQPVWGSRQHFLRWETPATFQALEDAGLDYDSTLGYADHIGFRCGVCYEYKAFNLKTRQELKLRERPLAAMDRTFMAGYYMGLTHEDAWLMISNLKDGCKLFNGDFTILWHNNNFIDKGDIELYKNIVKS